MKETERKKEIKLTARVYSSSIYILGPIRDSFMGSRPCSFFPSSVMELK